MHHRRFTKPLVLFVALASLAVSGCLAGTEEGDDYGEPVAEESAELYRNQTQACAGTKFDCDCAKIGGTVRDGMCCKDYPDGGSQCTNSPDLIIWWLTPLKASTSTSSLYEAPATEALAP